MGTLQRMPANTKNGRYTPPKAQADDTDATPPATLRLLKVVVQPVFVLIDADGQPTEVNHQPIAVNGADWATWSAAAFTPEALEALRGSIGAAPPQGG